MHFSDYITKGQYPTTKHTVANCFKHDQNAVCALATPLYSMTTDRHCTIADKIGGRPCSLDMLVARIYYKK